MPVDSIGYFSGGCFRRWIFDGFCPGRYYNAYRAAVERVYRYLHSRRYQRDVSRHADSGQLKGYKLFSVSTYYDGVTPPTDDSDLTITEGSAAGADILGGAGVDKIDIATNNFFKPLVGATPVDVPIYRPLYMQIDNNSVNDAVTVITLKFIQ